MKSYAGFSVFAFSFSLLATAPFARAAHFQSESLRCAEVAVDSPFSTIAHFEHQCWVRDADGRFVRFALDESGKPLRSTFVYEYRAQDIPLPQVQVMGFREETLARVWPLTAMTADIPFDIPQVGRVEYSSGRVPYRGYWYPHRENLLARDAQSPLAKFDRWVKAAKGQESKAVEWEMQNHAPSKSDWAGHCNGWSAGVALYSEPLRAVELPAASLSLSPTDLKGIIASTSSCVRYTFYGQRFNGEAGEDMKDIPADLFHEVLVNELGNRKRVVAIDTEAGVEVWNKIVAGAVFDTQKQDEHSFRVTAQLKVYAPDETFNTVMGAAPLMNFTYQYLLRTGANGEIVSGEWLSGNPDFLWVPLEPMDCGSPHENPYVTTSLVEDLLKGTQTLNLFRPILVD